VMDGYSGQDPGRQPRESSPSTPMTGSGATGRRRLPPEQMAPTTLEELSTYIPPSDPASLARDADPANGVVAQMARRRLVL
jgi:hypothetical protein